VLPANQAWKPTIEALAIISAAEADKQYEIRGIQTNRDPSLHVRVHRAAASREQCHVWRSHCPPELAAAKTV